MVPLAPTVVSPVPPFVVGSVPVVCVARLSVPPRLVKLIAPCCTADKAPPIFCRESAPSFTSTVVATNVAPVPPMTVTLVDAGVRF